MRNLYTFITIFTIVLYLVAGAMVLRAWKQGKAQRRFFFLLFFSAIWVIHLFLEFSIRNNFQFYQFLNHSEPIVASIVSYLFAIFALHFPRSNEKLTNFKELALFIPIIILAIANISNVIFVATSYNIIEINKGWYIIYITTLIIYFLILGGGTLIKKYLKLKGLLKLQLKYLLLGYLVSITLALYTSIHSALIRRLTDDQFLIFANVVVLFALSSSYAIIKYRLMDIRIVLRKGFVHGVSLLILLGIYTYLTLFFQDYFELSLPYTTLLALLVVILTIQPLRKRLFKNIDALFFKPEKEKENLKQFSTELGKGLTLSDLFQKARQVITSTLGCEEVKIFLYDKENGQFNSEYPENIVGKESISEDRGFIKYLSGNKEVVVKEEIPYLISNLSQKEKEELEDLEKELKKKQAEVVIPIGEEDIFALLFLGPKKSQEAFTVQDIRFLKNFARQFTLYLGNAILYKQAVERIRVNV